MGKGQFKDDLLLKRIASKVKKLRMDQKVTFLQFYNETNIHLSRIEHSKANISVSTLNAVCKYFGLTLHEFLKDIDKY